MNLTQSTKPATYDLHMHTCWSYDATADAELYFRKARELGMRCIAITEHHNIDGAQEIRAIAKNYPNIRWIPSAELSVTTSLGAIDLLCYNLPLHPSGLFADVLDEYHEWQRAAGAAISRAMVALGYPYDDAVRLALLRTYRPERVIEVQGATHVANPVETAYFIEQGYASSAQDRREKLRSGGITAPPYPSVDRVVKAVKAAGGLVAIAHPARYFKDDIDRMNQLRTECALDGIECAHPSVSPEQTQNYRAYCEKYGLFSTGGSDTHHNEYINYATTNWNSPEKCFAGHIGEDAWLDELLERISL